MIVKQNIFLIGPMGAGKSTVGRTLARGLGFEFYDTDEEIEKRTGVEVSWIFDIEGEAGFRARERQLINELTQLKKIVLATGGGVVVDEENRNILASRGLVIYLHVSIEQQLNRLEKDKRRPLLRTDNKRKKLESLFMERDALYREIADYSFNTDRLTPSAVANNILQDLLKPIDSQF